MKTDKIIHVLMKKDALKRTIKRMASEIIEEFSEETNLIIIGLKTRGVYVANRLIEEIENLNSGLKIEKGEIDVTLWRDDFRENIKIPNILIDDLPFDIENKRILLVDDVVYTGRTILAAINALMDIERPKSIHFAALIDRGNRELPLSADFIGKSIKTLPSQMVRVKLTETDNEDGVFLIEK